MMTVYNESITVGIKTTKKISTLLIVGKSEWLYKFMPRKPTAVVKLVRKMG